jgi:hypothetical protein
LEHTSDNADCHLKEKHRSCVEPLAFEYEGARYCELHLPREDKRDDIKRALDEKLGNRDYQFADALLPNGMGQFTAHELVRANSGAIFRGETSFREVRFSGERTYFVGAKFSGKSPNEWEYGVNSTNVPFSARHAPRSPIENGYHSGIYARVFGEAQLAAPIFRDRVIVHRTAARHDLGCRCLHRSAK